MNDCCVTQLQLEMRTFDDLVDYAYATESELTVTVSGYGREINTCSVLLVVVRC